MRIVVRLGPGRAQSFLGSRSFPGFENAEGLVLPQLDRRRRDGVVAQDEDPAQLGPLGMSGLSAYPIRVEHGLGFRGSLVAVQRPPAVPSVVLPQAGGGLAGVLVGGDVFTLAAVKGGGRA